MQVQNVWFYRHRSLKTSFSQPFTVCGDTYISSTLSDKMCIYFFGFDEPFSDSSPPKLLPSVVHLEISPKSVPTLSFPSSSRSFLSWSVSLSLSVYTSIDPPPPRITRLFFTTRSFDELDHILHSSYGSITFIRDSLLPVGHCQN